MHQFSQIMWSLARFPEYNNICVHPIRIKQGDRVVAAVRIQVPRLWIGDGLVLVAHRIHRQEPVTQVVVVARAEVVELSALLPLLAGKLRPGVIGVHPHLLDAAIRVVHRAVDHRAGGIGDQAAGTDRIGGVIVLLTGLRQVFRRQAVTQVDVLAGAGAGGVVLGHQFAVV